MYKDHHQKAIELALNHFQNDQEILALLLVGSLAHGFESDESDIDLILIVNSEDYQSRKRLGKITFCLRDICDYDGGYIDCKVVDLEFIKMVAQRGSDAARFAFKDAQVLYSNLGDLALLLERAQRFPSEHWESRRMRFASQLVAWKWFFTEGTKKQNSYLRNLALQKVVLFACRLVLNENSLLFPFHKWMLEVTANAENLPENFISQVDLLFGCEPEIEGVERFCSMVLDHYHIDASEINTEWPNYFLKDSEQNWVEHEPPVDDL